MINLIYFIIVLGVIVLIHEIGHFIFAKKFKVYVYEFAIGMGPKLFSRKGRNEETTYSIRAIPIGGFVSMAGEQVDDDTDIPKDRKLHSKPVWQRFLIMFSGAGFNFISAIFILFLFGLIWGSPDTRPIIGDVFEGGPAYQGGLQTGDYVKRINGKKISTSDDIAIYLQIEDKSKPVVFTVLRDNEKVDIDVVPVLEDVEGNKIYRVGIQINGEVNEGFLAAVKFGFEKTGSLIKQMGITLRALFTGGLSVSQLAGPVGIYNIVGDQADRGIENVIFLVALLSINVGFINLLPFPAFDGGRILFLIIEKIKGSPVPVKVENIIHSIGFFLLMALMVYITFNDILKLF